jgi:hypothetical protein
MILHLPFKDGELLEAVKLSIMELTSFSLSLELADLI